MVCLIKSKYEEELNHLTEVLGSYKRAYAVLCCNNGYTLDKTKEGKSSKLYNDLLEYYKGDVNKAEQKKAQLFTSDFTDTYGKWFQDGFEIQEQYKDVFDENGEPILFKSGKQVELTKEGISTEAQQKLNNANSFIKNHLQIKSGPIRNKRIGDDLQTLNNYIESLYYDITGQYLELDSNENIYDQIEFAINNTDFESATKEELKKLKDSQIKPNASSVVVKKSLIDSFLSDPDLSKYNEDQKQILKTFLPALFKSEDALTKKRIGFYKHNIKKIHSKIDNALNQNWRQYFANRGKQIKLQNFLDYLELSPDYKQHIKEKIFSEIGRYVARTDSKYFRDKNEKKNLTFMSEKGHGSVVQSLDFSKYYDQSDFKTTEHGRIEYGKSKSSNVLQKIINDESVDPRLRKSAEFLLKYTKNQDFEIIFEDPGDRNLVESKRVSKTASGVTDTMARTIYIRVTDAYQNKESTLIHEIAHSVTTAILYEQQTDNTKTWRGLEAYMRYIDRFMSHGLDGAFATNHWRQEPQEFVAEFFGNAEFQEMLKEIPPVDQKKFNNIFEELLNWLYELFTGKPANAFEQIKPVMEGLVVSQADRNLIDKVHFQEQNYLETPYFGTSNDKISLEEQKFEQPYDAERFATSEQRMEEQYNSRGVQQQRSQISRDIAVKYITDQGYTIYKKSEDTTQSRLEITTKALEKKDVWKKYIEHMDPNLRVTFRGLGIGTKDARLEVVIRTKQQSDIDNLRTAIKRRKVFTAEHLLDYIKKQTSGENNDNFKFILQVLKDIQKHQLFLFSNITVETEAHYNKTFAAKYDAFNQTIVINTESGFMNENGFENTLAQTIAHELIHAVTVDALQRSKVLRAKAEKLLSKLKEQFNDDPSIQGLQNVYEMVAELSNDEFINKLKQVQYDTKQTWLDKIKSFISRLISRYLQSIGIQYNNTAYKELVDIFVQASYSKQIGLELGENIDDKSQFNRLWFNKQSYIDRFKEARRKIRAAKDQRLQINKIRTNEERTIQDLFESIESSTLSKDKSYKSKFSETSSIYGDEKQIAFNQNAVREVQMQHQTIAEAIESKSADEVMTAFAEGVLQFVERADTDINNILAMLINAKDNNYDMVYYNIDNFGNRVYQDVNGNSITAATATNTTQTQPFSFDEIQYITKDICGFYDNLLSNVERMLVIIQPDSNPVIDEISRLISDLDLRKKLTHIQNMKRIAQEHMLDFWIKEKIDSQESSELTDDMKKRLSVNIKKWVSAQYDFGDTNSFERICGLFSDAKSPVVRMVVDEIYKMAQETDRRTEEDIDGIKEQYDKALREHSLIGKASMVNPLTYLMQKDRRGLYNGDFIQPINKRQFYTDLEDFKAWLLYGKRKTHDKKHNSIFYTYKNIEDMIKEELGDKDFKLDLDEYGNPDIPITTPKLRSIYKDYLRGMNEFMSKYANRRFTREYYAERIDTLSAVTLKAVDSLNSQITAIKKSCTINGKFKPNLLTNSQRAQLQELQKQRLNLSSYYDEFGNEKQIDSDEYQIAADLNSFQNKTSGKIKYNPDYESFDDILNSIQSPIEKRQFQAMFSYVGINPKYLDMIEQSEYDGSDVDIAEGLQEIKELGRDLRKLINLHKLNDTYVSYDWSFIFDIHTKKLTKNGIKFLQKINELQTRIEDIKYAIKPGLKGHFNVIKPGTKKNSVISDAFLGVKCIDGTLGNNDFTFREDGSLSQYLMRAYVQQLEDEGMSVTDAQSKADQLFYTRDGNVLKVFTIPIPHTNTFKYKDGNTIRTENSYKIIPNLLFNKLDVDNSDSKYVNKDYNESDNDFVQPKDEYYHDSQYDKVKNTKPELFKLMQLLQEKLDSRVYKQLPFLQQYDGRLPQIGARSMSILTRNLTNKAGLQIFSNLSTIWNRDVNANEQDTDLYIPEKTKRPDGSEIKNIPIRYVDRLEDPSMVSSDLVGSVVAMIRMANNYKVKIENVNKFETILTNIQENENTQSTHSKQFEDMMNRDIYERRAHTDLFSEDWEHFNWFRKLIFGGSATFLKRIGIVRGISQKVMLACRLVSQIVSMLDPLMCTLVEVGCGRYYNKRDFTKAVTLLIKELPAAMLSLGKSGSYSRTMGIIDSLQLGESLTKRYQNLYRTQIGRVISMVDGMTPFSMGDYFIKALNVNMIYNSTRMYIDNNGNIEFLSKEPFIDKCVENGMSFKEANRAYYNAKTARNCVKVINGQIKITDSRMTPEQYQSIGNRTKKITQTMTRMVLEEDKTWLQTNTWAAFVTMLRTFLLVGISERFRNHNDFIVGETKTGEITDRRLNKSDIREARKKHYYRGGFNFMTGFIENGIYRSFFSGIGHILSNTKRMQTVLSSFLFKYKHVSQQDMKNMDLSRQEVYAVSKVLRELGLVTMFVTASVMMNAYVSTLPPDDEHWLLFLINAVLMRQGIEMMTMYNPSTVSDLITSITTLTSSVDRVSQILDLLGDYIGITGHNPDEIIKSSSQYKNRTRQYKALMNAFAYFGTAGWYASMPKSMGGGGSYALDKSTQWYANTAPWRLLYKKQNVDVDKPKKKRSRPIGVN